MFRRVLFLSALLSAVLPAAPAAAATTFSDAKAGVTVRVAASGRTATIAYDGSCKAEAHRVRVRRGRISLRATVFCPWRDDEASLEVPREALVVRGVVGTRAIRGTVSGRRFDARRNGRKRNAVERCTARGTTAAENELVRVYRQDHTTVACRRTDGAAHLIGARSTDEDGYYSSGALVWQVQVIGSRVAFEQDPFDSAASKYGQGDHPMFNSRVVVRDLASGAVMRAETGMPKAGKVVMREDGAVAWAGPAQPNPGTAVRTVQDGAVVTLDEGAIDPQSLRVENGAFAWTRT